MAERADLLIRAGSVLTPSALAASDGVDSRYVAILDGTIVGVGPADEIDSWVAVHTIDLPGATIAPGLIDAHIHPIMGLELTRGVDLSGLTDLEAVRAALAAHCAAAEGDWVLGWGLDPNAFGAAEPSVALFDGIDDSRPIYLSLFDGHGGLASRRALQLAGITGDETFDDASSVVVDADGMPTGLLLEMRAVMLVWSRLPAQTFEERLASLSSVLNGMAESGLVGGHMLDLSAVDSLLLLEELERRGDLPIRLRISPFLMPGFTDADLARVVALQGTGGRRWEVRGVKLMIDGTIDNGTAWLYTPDARGESTESLWLQPEEYRRAVGALHERGIPTATHAIGDRGIAFVAETLAALESTGVRHRIEHIETLPDSVLDTIIRAGAAASMQPTHCTHYTRADHTDNWSTRLGDARADRAWRIADLRARGAIVTLGSDWPIAPFDPRATIAAAVLRRPAGNPDIAPNQPSQAISVGAALEGYSREYWRSVGEAGGSIEVGQRADLTVFAANPLTTHPDDFAHTSVLLTVVDGEVVVETSEVAPATGATARTV